MITSYLLSYNLPRPLVRLTPITRTIDYYPILPFSLPHPWEFQYLFLCRTNIIMNQNNKSIRIASKNDRSIIITQQKQICKNITYQHILTLWTFSIYFYIGAL